MKILLVEDNKKLGGLIKFMLEQQHFEVMWLEDGEVAWQAIQTHNYDVLLLDWMLPSMSGIEMCEKLRKKGNRIPVLILTARDTLEDRVIGLEFGADDYLVKPFEFSELIARLHALYRRSKWQVESQKVELGRMSLNGLERKVSVDGENIQLTAKEFQLLDLMIQNAGITLPRELMMERIWGWDTEITPNNLDAHIRRLRKKVDFIKGGLTLHTIHGIGYRLEVSNV